MTISIKLTDTDRFRIVSNDRGAWKLKGTWTGAVLTGYGGENVIHIHHMWMQDGTASVMVVHSAVDSPIEHRVGRTKRERIVEMTNRFLRELLTAPEVASQPETSPSQPEEESVTLVVTGDVSATEQFPASTSLKDVLKKLKVPSTSQLRASTGIITEKNLSVGQVGRDAQGNVAISVTKKVSGG